MASNSKKTSFRRARRAKKMGAARKTHNRLHGSTPAFPIHTPDADANSPAAQLSPSVAADRED